MKKQTFNKTALYLAIAVSVGGLASQTFAQSGFLTEKTQIVNGSLVEIGTPQNLSNLKGFAKDLPLIIVLKQITPNEWVVKKAKGRTLDLEKKVSWTGGKNWVNILKEIAENNGIEAVVNWDKKEVVLAEIEIKSSITPIISQNSENKKITVKPTDSVGVFELSSDVVAEGNSEQKLETNPVIKEEPKSVMVTKTWSFEGLDNLKDVIQSWGRKANYKVVYIGENYPIDKEDTRVFSGEFDGEDGPIKQLSIDYGQSSRVKKPLLFTFFQNRTLVVEDLKYEQSGYPQYIQK
jgi:hypothetical protein